MYKRAALSFGLIQACWSGLVLYSTVLSHAVGENDAISDLRHIWKITIESAIMHKMSHWNTRLYEIWNFSLEISYPM